MRKVEYDECVIVSGGVRYGITVGLSMLGTGILLTALGIMSFTPLRRGDVETDLVRETYEGYSAGLQATLYSVHNVGTIEHNAPLICGRCPVFANMVLWYGVGLIAGGITALGGSI